MKKQVLMLTMIVLVAAPAHSQTNYKEMADFAESICGSIPSGSLTRTTIQGKVEANAGTLARIVGGSAGANASEQKEVYNGIPFDRLPSSIPTVSMCKSELIKVLLAHPRVSINTCRHPDFGQAGWRRTETYTDSSGRVGGGHDQNWWCNRVIASFLQSRSVGSLYDADIVDSHEESNKDWRGRVTYKYHCTIEVSWGPIYREKRDPRCGVTVQ